MASEKSTPVLETPTAITAKKVRVGTWLDTKLGVTMVLSKDDCRQLGFSENLTTTEVIRQVRSTLGLTEKRKAN